MRIAAALCLLTAALCGAFAYWGTQTVAGRHAYDEMAGIVPVAAGLLGLVLVVAAALIAWLSRRAPAPLRT